MATISYDEWSSLIKSKDYPSQLKAAAIKKMAEGDTELAQTMQLLSTQLDFATGDDETVQKTREKLSVLIDARWPWSSMKYHDLMFDEEVVGLTTAEVTTADSIYHALAQWFKGGLYDPAIFGGSGLVPTIDETGHILKSADGKFPFSSQMGRITLPMHVVLDSDLLECCLLTDFDETFVKDLIRYAKWLVLDENGNWDRVSVMDTKTVITQYPNINDIPENIISGGSALHKILVDLRLPDHPERLAFRVLPVAPTLMRPAGVDRNSFKYRVSAVTKGYEEVISRRNRVNRLLKLNAPTIIMVNEFRLLKETVDTLFETIGKEFGPKDKRTVGYALATRLRVIWYQPKPFVAESIKPYGFAEFADVYDGASHRKVLFVDVLKQIDSRIDELRDRAFDRDCEAGPNESEAAEDDALMDKIFEEMRVLKQKAISGPVFVIEDEDGNFHPAPEN